MKGIVFTGFLEMIGEAVGLGMVDRVIDAATLPNKGAYTSVGTYDHREMMRLVAALSAATGQPVSHWLNELGRHLFRHFSVNYPAFFRDCPDAFEFLQQVDRYIHVEVRKLYPDAEMPKFSHQRVDNDELALLYESPRCLGDLAEGLIRGCIAHFGQPLRLTRHDLPKAHGGEAVVFRVVRAASGGERR